MTDNKNKLEMDQILNWFKAGEKKALEDLKGKKIDTALHIFPNKKLAQLFKKACIPVRLGSRSRIYHWWTCTKTVSLKRSGSFLHESLLNFKLLGPLLSQKIPSRKELSSFCHLKKIRRVQ